MSKTSHLYRRGNVLYFRLSVPHRYRSILHVCEFTQSLRTQSRQVAIPAAYTLAAKAKTLFLSIDTMINNDLTDDEINAIINKLDREDREASTKKTDELITELAWHEMEASKKKTLDDYRNDFLNSIEGECERDDIEASKKNSYDDSIQKLITDNKFSIDALEDSYKEELELITIKVKASAFETIKSMTLIGASTAQQATIIEKPIDNKAPMLSAAYNDFLKDRTANKKKLGTFGNLFIKGYLGDKQIDLITQKEVNEFFRLLVNVAGGRGGSSDADNKLNIHERVTDAEKNNNLLMSPDTFKNTYVGSAGQFFKYLKLRYEDYAPLVSVGHINYKDFGGLRERGENKQRSLWTKEVAILMDCKPMKDYSKSIKESHRFWLPMIGLFTGARVNEICQLNPQSDITKDEKSGIWYFNLTDDGAGVGVEKSHKNDHSKRKVPIHAKLIECGLLDYLDKVKTLKHDRIFNRFKPKAGKASYYAEEFFRKYLKDIGLYDNNTKGKNVLGMHCLRGTFISHTVKGLMSSGDSRKQALSKIQPIVGHADGLADENGKDLSVTAGYIDEDILYSVSDNLESLKVIIEALDYEISFPILNS